MNNRHKPKLAAYIADYISEEIIRGNVEIDLWMVQNAIDAFEGGAHDGDEYAVTIEKQEVAA